MKNQQLNILCADDEPSVCCVLKDYLGELGHNVDIAENGSLAYHFVRTRNYDLVFMDKNMPVMDGIDSVRAIRESNRSVYIVIMSGCDHDKVLDGLLNGANAFMPKPFYLEMLDRHIAMAFQQKA
jgi:two-component system, OmpR family, response regulator